MNIITAIIIGFLVLLAIHVIYYFMTSNSIDDMKQTIRADIKMLEFEDVFDYLLAWLVCSAILWAVVNVCGLLIGIFIAADVNFFELVYDFISYDPLAEPITLTNLTALS